MTRAPLPAIVSILAIFGLAIFGLAIAAGPAAGFERVTHTTPAGSEIGIWPGDDFMPEVMRFLERHHPDVARLHGTAGRIEIRLAPEDQRTFAADPQVSSRWIDGVWPDNDSLVGPEFDAEEAARAGHVTGLVLVTEEGRAIIIWH